MAESTSSVNSKELDKVVWNKMRKITYFSVFINTVFVYGKIDLVESTESDAWVLFIETNLPSSTF